MVRLLNLDGDNCADAVEDVPPEDGRPNPNLNSLSEALSCYPIVSQLARYLDLNSLHELSRTCRQVRAGLLQHRNLLVTQTLRCENEDTNPAQRLGNALHASREVWTAYGRNGVKIGRITGGKVGACARDMVGACRHCGQIVCRNCVIKAPPSATVKGRHRRLCRTCVKAPLDRLTTVERQVEQENPDDDSSRVTETYTRSPCSCHDNVWICQPCGQALRPADTIYIRGWAWRTRYSAFGGLGAGLGEGNEGVECGQTSNCLAARMVEKDVECDAAELAALEAEMAKAEIEGRQWNGSSYSTQEIVGIGGKVKQKAKKRVPVGAIVKEYEDERVSEEVLGREQRRANRSWCSWCARVIVGKKDEDDAMRSTDSIASCSSSD